MHDTFFKQKAGITSLTYILVVALCILLTGCTINLLPTSSNQSSCSNPCTFGSGVQNVQVFVEPEAGEQPILAAMQSAKKSIWLEMYLLTDRNVLRALEEAANRGVDVRVMLEPHPFGGGSSPARTLDQLNAAGAKVQPSSPAFSLTHEKGMIIDGTTVYIMTSNFTRSALGGSGGSSVSNREYDIIDTNPDDVSAAISIFQADWDHTPASFNDPNLVVSPVNSRNAFLTLINSTHNTLLLETEEMNDTAIEQALVNVAQHGIHVQVILPAPQGSSTDTNSLGIATLRQGGVQVREDARLYMHAKMIVVDGQRAFVGSENISAQSLDQNRELGILVADAGVLNTLQQTFQGDWTDSH